MKIFFSLLLVLKTIESFAQAPLPHGHAHNDYEHTHPLMDALAYGFTSVEADVHLIEGELYVSHDTPTNLKGITLEKLYLHPLAKILKNHKGSVFKHFVGTFYLVIDIKTNAEATYKALRKLLLRYPVFANNYHIKIYLTSFQDLHFVQGDTLSVAGIDGRPEDLGKGFSNEFMPVISQSFKIFSSWNGSDSIPSQHLTVLKDIIKRTHGEGKKIRFWAIPDNENAWKTLLESGVDFINTDRLKEFSEFSKMN